MNRTLRVAINGAGRIGRAFLKLAQERKELEVVAINDLGDIHNIAYLMNFDSAYGRSNLNVQVKEGNGALVIKGKEVKYISEKDPAQLPWKNLEIDVVIESTGLFTSYTKAEAHIKAGAKRVVITAPAKDDPNGPKTPTILMGINENEFADAPITSNASCTTNAAAAPMFILDKYIGIEKAILSTVHAYTASQSIVDGPNKKDWKEGRAAAHNIVPTTTGAAIAVTKALKDLDKKFDGVSMRVPVIAGSIVDITFVAKRGTTVDEVNNVLTQEAMNPKWHNIFSVTTDELVSSDIVGAPYASIADLSFTKVIDGNLVKVLAWYDNEMGYTNSLVLHVLKAGEYL